MITILDPPSLVLIPSHLSVVVEDVVKLYRQSFDARLISVYVLGSVVRGDFRPGVSDIDVVGIITAEASEDRQYIQTIQMQLHEKFGLGHLDLDLYELQKLNKKPWLQFFLLAGGLCVWGSNYELTYPLPTDRDELAHLLATFILERYDRIYRMLQGVVSSRKEPDTTVVRRLYANHAKRAIRLANAIVILRTGLYTNSTETMTRLIAEYVPEIREAVNRVDSNRINPPVDFGGLIEFLEEAEVIRDFVLCHRLTKCGTLRQEWRINMCASIRRRLLGPARRTRWHLRYNVRARATRAWCRVTSTDS